MEMKRKIAEANRINAEETNYSVPNTNLNDNDFRPYSNDLNKQEKTSFRQANNTSYSSYNADMEYARKIFEEHKRHEDEERRKAEEEQRKRVQMELLKKQEEKYCAVIGVTSAATNDEIIKSYHSLIKKYHPDNVLKDDTPDDIKQFVNKKFIDIQSAYQNLCKIRGI